jgi:gliding motility-associated-like protein
MAILKKPILLLLIAVLSNTAMAQLVANFKPDVLAGCSPLAVNFQNLSTGTSGTTTYQWNFGNNKTSTLFNPGTTYINEVTYSVTLIVKDGTQSSTKTIDITVYKKPQADFVADASKGCIPLDINFTSKSSAGDGDIVKYFWDFGDGHTTQGENLSTVATQYIFSQKANVQLTVTNSFGCQGSVEKKEIIEVFPLLKSSFTADKLLVCDVNAPIKFASTASETGPLFYKWSFGDNTTSTNANPVHTYKTKGSYPVKLETTNLNGCKSEYVLSQQLDIANFSLDFKAEPIVCLNSTHSYEAIATPTASSYKWMITGNPAATYGNKFANKFTKTGDELISLVAEFGTCTSIISKIIHVNALPDLKGFVVQKPKCGAPDPVIFQDTTASAVKWKWSQWPLLEKKGPVFSDEKNSSYAFDSNSEFYVNLTLEDKYGCEKSYTELIKILPPPVSINYTTNATPGVLTCQDLDVKFKAVAVTPIVNYLWNFGDGTTSSLSEPQHLFDKVGTYNVELTFTNSDGCVGTRSTSIRVFIQPKADFESPVQVCGNTPVLFENKSNTTEHSLWSFGDGGISTIANATYQYYIQGIYTVSLTITSGTCTDTKKKTNLITVFPPFTRIGVVANTCAGNRDEVIVTDESKQAQAWSWDFGDSSPAVNYVVQKPQVKHTYSKSGNYKIILTTTNGICNVKDSIMAYVLLKQNPVLTINKEVVCFKDSLIIDIDNLETNPYPISSNASYYYNYAWEYNDITKFNGSFTPLESFLLRKYTDTLTGLKAGKQGIRLILESAFFACKDTSAFVPIKINGPNAAFTIQNNNTCYKTPVLFNDISQPSNGIPIAQRTWLFGDGIMQIETSNLKVNHAYSAPNSYSSRLIITDEAGCTDTSLAKTINTFGPKAGFTWDPFTVYPGVPINFINTTNGFGAVNTKYEWSFTNDQSTSLQYSVNKKYQNHAKDTVRLITSTIICADTLTQIIPVNNVIASFTYESAYINNNSCPPLVAYFKSKSFNVISLRWNFGDGGKSDDNPAPSHTYTTPGIYKVQLVVIGRNNISDTTTEFIIVKGPYATVLADINKGCSPTVVKLEATTKNAVSYTWDFGDGTILNTSDTIVSHFYNVAGLYSPALIMKDNSGCAATFSVQQKILIDSLAAKFNFTANLVCDSAKVLFSSTSYGFANSNVAEPIKYSWSFGTGIPGDTSDLANPFYYFNKNGKYMIRLVTRSSSGCISEITDSVLVTSTAKALISAVSEICPDKPVELKGASSLPGSLSWSWDFANNNTGSLQMPPIQLYSNASDYLIRLILDKEGCKDTAFHKLVVHPIPVVGLESQKNKICLSQSIQLKANDGIKFLWKDDPTLSDIHIANPFAKPIISTKYFVLVTNKFGCTNTDSVIIKVVQPFKLEVMADTFICPGKSIHLLATGAAKYKWISGTDLSDVNVHDPWASPKTKQQYTVVGYVNDVCFTDTATINIDVKPLPFIDAGKSYNIVVGSTINPNISYATDVVEWKWTPSDYLSCSDCPSPVINPRTDIMYRVAVTSKYGCIASDTFSVKLFCSKSVVFIPNTFTPNGDGMNDIFYIRGKGIRKVKRFAIFNRLGEKLFEKMNFNVNDPSNGWGTNYLKNNTSTNVYTYIAEFICDTGEEFKLEGSIMIVR